jgi:hypothetical protein
MAASGRSEAVALKRHAAPAPARRERPLQPHARLRNNANPLRSSVSHRQSGPAGLPQSAPGLRMKHRRGLHARMLRNVTSGKGIVRASRRRICPPAPHSNNLQHRPARRLLSPGPRPPRRARIMHHAQARIRTSSPATKRHRRGSSPRLEISLRHQLRVQHNLHQHQLLHSPHPARSRRLPLLRQRPSRPDLVSASRSMRRGSGSRICVISAVSAGRVIASSSRSRATARSSVTATTSSSAMMNQSASAASMARTVCALSAAVLTRR